MWVYFNDNGQVITSIPHGETIKQGGSFNVYVAFNKSYFQNLIGKESILYTSEELINWINANICATFTFEEYADQYPFAELKKFEKIKDNESICMLRDNETYVVFHYKGLPNETELYGDFELIFRLARVTRDLSCRQDSWEHICNSVTEHEVCVQGPINIYIESTYGYKPISTNVSKEQIDILLDVIKEHAFNQKILGDGFYVKMSGDKVYSPINGVVVSVFPTNHAFCIKGHNGEEIMVHIGVDTNLLNSGVIESKFKKGDEISEGDLLAEINLEEFKRLRIDAEVYVFILNDLEIDKDYRNDKSYVYDGDCILELKE